jgi:hypothetical protein
VSRNPVFELRETWGTRTFSGHVFPVSTPDTRVLCPVPCALHPYSAYGFQTPSLPSIRTMLAFVGSAV